jgi:hypothetical protein
LFDGPKIIAEGIFGNPEPLYQRKVSHHLYNEMMELNSKDLDSNPNLKLEQILLNHLFHHHLHLIHTMQHLDAQMVLYLQLDMENLVVMVLE